MLKLDLACGLHKKEGFVGVDISPQSQADLVFDLRVTPWPWGDASVSEVNCSHFFEHLDGDERLRFMEELYRVLVPGGKATIVVPHARNDGALQDPTHVWPPLIEKSFVYFNREAREQMGITHYPIQCDFEIEIGVALEPHWEQRQQEEKSFALKHFNNVAKEIHAFLTKR
jgi:SAM-dependent methyltransferase